MIFKFYFSGGWTVKVRGFHSSAEAEKYLFRYLGFYHTGRGYQLEVLRG